MNLEEALKRIKELEAENEKKDNEIYELNKKLNEALIKISVYQEKYGIERTRQFIPKNEKLENIVINEVEEIIKEEKEKKTNKGKKYNKKKFDYESHVSEVRYIEAEESVCEECGRELVKASEKVRYVVETIPSSIKVIKIVKVNKKCPKCNKENNKIYYPLSREIDGGILTPSLASYIAYHKYELGIPFHHLARHISESVGFEITKQNLANYMAKIANILEPIYEKMRYDLLSNKPKVIHSDETTLVVSKRDEENKDRKKSYVYVYTSSYYDRNQIRIYEFNESRSIENTSKWLANYEGYIVCDAYNGYESLKNRNDKIKFQKCWAHVRRNFTDILKNINSKDRINSLSYKILTEIEKLFKLEKSYRESKLIPSEIVKRRKEDMLDIKTNLEQLIFTSNPASGSALEKAINYTKKCWEDLFTIFENGYLELTNNTAERAVKPFVIQRKVFQTSGSYSGARYTSKLFSIVQTCKINNVNVEKYLSYVLENIDNKNIEDLLPYSKSISNKLSNNIVG